MTGYFEDHGLPLVQLKEQRRDLVVALIGRHPGPVSKEQIAEIAAIQQTIAAVEARPDRWSWEIRRKSTPLGIKMIGEGYQSDTAAKFAGKQALANFLFELLKEEKRK